MEQRPTCPHCGDVLIQGECITHGVIVPRSSIGSAPAGESIDSAPAGEPTDLEGASPPDPLSDEDLRRLEGAPPDVARRRAEPARVILLIAGFVIVALLIGGAFALRSASNATAALSDRVDALTKTVTDLSDQMTTGQEQLGKRLGAVEQKVAGQFDSAAIARKVRPSVFTIEAGQDLGSGFVIESGDGVSTLITNFHVIQSVGERGRVRVRRSGLSAMNGTVTGIDPENDLALVRIPRVFPALPRSTDIPTTGEPVVVVGSPLGLGGTVTTGIVSGEREGYVQFSAPVSPGSSGGPVVNRNGQVIGISDLKIIGFGAEGLSFAVPIVRICDLLVAC